MCGASEGRVEKAARLGQARFATVAVATGLAEWLKQQIAELTYKNNSETVVEACTRIVSD